MYKKILLSYKYETFTPFGDGEYYETYILKTKSMWLWGLIHYEDTIRMKIYPLAISEQSYKSHWDELIKTKKSI